MKRGADDMQSLEALALGLALLLHEPLYAHLLHAGHVTTSSEVNLKGK